MTISQYLIDLLIENGVTDFFLVTGGAIIPTVDYIGERAKSGDCRYFCFQHEQSAAMAAEGYYRASGRLACVLSTSGPGAQNLLNGVCGCWFDSIPAIFITGQTNEYETINDVRPYKPRQVGFQECPVVDVFKPFTKYCAQLSEDNYIEHITLAFNEVITPRMGPILFDIPVNVQNSLAKDTRELRIKNVSRQKVHDHTVISHLQHINSRCGGIKKPLVLIGNGARDHVSLENIKQFIELNKFPFVVSWGGFDLIEHNHPLFVGHIGVYGKREANFALQNCDALFVFGSRLDTRQTGGKLKSFAPQAKKIVFDVDENEVFKRPELGTTINYIIDDLKYSTEYVKNFNYNIEQDQKWLKLIQGWKAAPHGYEKAKKAMSSYEILDCFFDNLPENALVIPDQGGNLVWTMQSAKLKKGQNLFSNFGNSSMGYALPAAIGAYLSGRKGPIYVIDGDGGFQMNIQELQTIKHYNIPVKIIILNNRSYGIIKQFQDTFFGSRYIATDQGDYSSPNFCEIANSYGIYSCEVTRSNYRQKIKDMDQTRVCPELYDFAIDKGQKLEPKLEFGNSLENMSPYWPKEKIKKNMMREPEPANIPKGWVNLKN